MRKFALGVGVMLATSLVFLSGVLLGNHYQITDFLCPASPSPYMLPVDMLSPEGIVFPKGTIVPLRSCEYMQRFKWNFAIDKWVELQEVKQGKISGAGFSVISPRE